MSAVAALIVGGPLWEVQICLDVSLALYVALLVVAKQRRAEVVKKLRSMETRPESAREPRSIETRRQTVEEPRFFEPLRAGGRSN